MAHDHSVTHFKPIISSYSKKTLKSSPTASASGDSGLAAAI